MSNSNKQPSPPNRSPISEQDWEEWKANPISEQFFLFLGDSRTRLLEMRDTPEPSSLDELITMGTVSTRISAMTEVLQDLIDINSEEINEFYEPESKDSDESGDSDEGDTD